jgi:hypothetical protein
MITMLVYSDFISSLSSKMPSWQGVSFQLISRCDNLRLEEEDSGTYAPDVPRPPGA